MIASIKSNLSPGGSSAVHDFLCMAPLSDNSLKPRARKYLWRGCPAWQRGKGADHVQHIRTGCNLNDLHDSININGPCSAWLSPRPPSPLGQKRKRAFKLLFLWRRSYFVTLSYLMSIGFLLSHSVLLSIYRSVHLLMYFKIIYLFISMLFFFVLESWPFLVPLQLEFNYYIRAVVSADVNCLGTKRIITVCGQIGKSLISFR